MRYTYREQVRHSLTVIPIILLASEQKVRQPLLPREQRHPGDAPRGRGAALHCVRRVRGVRETKRSPSIGRDGPQCSVRIGRELTFKL